MDVDASGRTSLKRFHGVLEAENPERRCFICEAPIESGEVSVDHVIPWSFMYSDDVWNLVFVHRACNSRKHKTVPSEAEIELLKERNKRLLEALKASGKPKNKYIFELEDALIHDLARRFWVQCMG